MEASDLTTESTDEQQQPTTDELLHQLLEQQQQQRDEVAALRTELAQAKSSTSASVSSVAPLSAEELLAARQEEVGEHSHYCPACGRLSHYIRECVGLSADKPHPPVDMVPTDELHPDADPSEHTVAPNTDHLG